MTKPNTNIISFQNQKVRRVEYNGEWWFSVVDIVAILTDSTNPTNYIKKVKQRDNELQKGWGQIVTLPLFFSNSNKWWNSKSKLCQP